MHPRVQEVLKYLDETSAELRAAVDSVPAALRERRPASDRWSVAEVLEHLTLVEHRIAQMATAQIAAGRTRGLGPDTATASAFDAFDAGVIVDRSRRIAASEAARPRQGLDTSSAWAALLEARTAVREAVLSGDGLALGELVVPHSVLGHLNLYHWIAFIGAHELRHAEQIREIRSHLTQPDPADPRILLESARSVLLVDWPHTGVPRALLASGLAVFGYSPNGYSAAAIENDRPADVADQAIFAPTDDGESGFLVFRRVDQPPSHVDLVNAYRPPHELPGILANVVLPSGARTLWLQPPNMSEDARSLAAVHGLAFVEGADIAEVARTIRVKSESLKT